MSNLNDGDWVEGEAKWWWKYVMPSESVFWGAILAAKYKAADPEPSPWYQGVSAQVMDGLAMLNAAARLGKGGEADKLKTEGSAKIVKAASGVR